nr:cation:proton antiporter [Pseudomonas sp. BP8]
MLLVAEVLGRLATALGQSRVIGEIAAGVVLGPIILGGFFHEASSLIITGGDDVIRGLSELALILMIFEVPWHVSRLESRECKVKNSSKLVISLFGVIIPFVTGAVIGAWSWDKIAPTQPYWQYIIFCGVVLSVTALPVLIRLIESNLAVDRQAASLALGVAVYTDVFGWLALAIVLAFEYTDSWGVLWTSLEVGCFILVGAASLLVVRPWFNDSSILSGVQGKTKILVVLLCCLTMSELTARLGFHHAIGSVISAYVFRDVPGVKRLWKKWIGRFSAILLTPLFFVYSGMQVKYEVLVGVDVWVWGAVFFLGGTAGKVAGSYIGGRLIGLGGRSSLELGILMNTKGLIELVILNVGLQEGILSDISYSVLLLISLVSTMLTLPLIRLSNCLGFSSVGDRDNQNGRFRD